MEQELNNEKTHTPKSKFERYITKPHLIIKDPMVFKIDSVPSKVIERKEGDDFYRELAVFVSYGKPNNLLIKGFPGSGKTVTVNSAMESLKKLKKDIDIYQVNCYGKSSSDVLKIMVKNNQQKSMQQMMQAFLENQKKDCIVVLDEVDRSDRVLYLLYYLSRPKEMYSSFNKNIELVLVSNNFAWKESLPDKIRSSLQLTEIVFSPYNISEIENIIKQRIKHGFIDIHVISDELINHIAKKVVEERRSDCRLAIEIIFYSALEAERCGERIISEKHVNSALKAAIYALDKQMVSKLDDHQLLTLIAVCLNDISSLEDLYKRYVTIIRDNNLNVKGKSKVMVHHFLNYLDDIGAVDKMIDVRRTQDNVPKRSLKAKCKIDKMIVIDELNIRGLRLTDSYEQQ